MTDADAIQELYEALKDVMDELFEADDDKNPETEEVYPHCQRAYMTLEKIENVYPVQILYKKKS